METTNAIQQIYIGLLGRAADQEGLQYWTDEIEAGTLSLEQLRANIVNEQPEYEANFGGQTRAQVISQLYANLFDRAPDSEGLQYWVNGGGASVNIDQLVLALVNGAAASDTLVLDNRAEVANYYTAELGAAGSFNAGQAAAVIANVDGTRASVTQAKAAVDNNDITEVAPNEGQSFTLTSAIGEIVNGTAGNDTFSAVLGDSAANSTLNIGDVINGNGGINTLNLTVADGTAGLPVGAQLNSVQVLNLNNTSADTVFATSFTAGTPGDPTATPPVAPTPASSSIDASASSLSGVKQIWQGNFAVNGVTGLAADQTIGFRKTASDDLGTVATNATATTVNVAFDGAAAATDSGANANEFALAVSGAKLNTINVDGTIAKAAGAAGSTPAAELQLAATVDAAATSVTLNTAVATAVTFSENSATAKDVVTLDASGSTGATDFGTTAFAGSFANIENIKLGSGNDEITLAAAAGKDTSVDLGAGNDTVNLTSSGSANATTTITLGAGSDQVKVAGDLGNIATATQEDFLKSLITITDFNGAAGQDTISFGAVSGTAATKATLDNTQLNALDTALNGEGGLWAGLNYLAAQTAEAQVVSFVFEGDTYIFDSSNAAAGNGVTTGDTLIQLAGVTDTLNDSNFVMTAA